MRSILSKSARLILIVCVLLGSPSCATYSPSVTQSSPTHYFAIHRGRCPGKDDNSLSRIRDALAKKIPLLEVDVRWSKDREILLFHDSTFSHTNSRGDDSRVGKKISMLSLKEIRESSLPQGEPLPLLREVLRETPPHGSKLLLDLKSEKDPGFLHALSALVQEERGEERIVFHCKTFACAETLLSLNAKYAIDIRCRSPEEVERALMLSPTMIELERWYDQKVMRKIQQRDVRVLINVSQSPFDTSSHWEQFFNEGVDVVMTDKGGCT